MIFLDEHASSPWPKAVFVLALSGTVFTAVILALIHASALPAWLAPHVQSGDLGRRILVSACAILYLLRVLLTLLVFVQRRFVWRESLLVTFLMSFALWAFVRAGSGNPDPLGAVEFVGLGLFLLGSWINSHAELARFAWKRDPENAGRLYRGGLFKYAMHVNYFGDAVLFTGFALSTGRAVLLVIPLVMTVNFVVHLIPTLDRHLARKYGEEFRQYAANTRKLVPFIY